MAKSDAATVQEWMTLIKVACDPDSPFRGLVDLTEIFKLPLSVQHLIFNEMTDQQKVDMAALYGPKKEVVDG